MALDIPPAIHERVVCSVAAAAKYGIPANIMLAVAFQEAGRPGQAVENENGTYDFGAMQINTVWLADLARFGITSRDVSAPGCYTYDLAAWRIRHHIKTDKLGDIWQKVANYHSYTPEYNLEYRRLIMRRASYWADWLEKRFITVEIQKKKAVTALSSENAKVSTGHQASEASRVRPSVSRSAPYVPRTIIASN